MAEPDNYTCKWVECTHEPFEKQAHLVNHLNSTHVAHLAHLTPTTPIRYTCQWEGCNRFGTEQPSKFALLLHCRTHTGERPYFCPIPECEKHFPRSDALAKHVKGVHGIYSLKEVMRATHVADTATQEEYLLLIEKDYQFTSPWWFSNKFLELLRQGLDGVQNNHYENTDDDSIDPRHPLASSVKVNVSSLYNLPYDFTQHKIAHARYSKYVRLSEELITPTDEKNRLGNVIHRQNQLVRESRGEPAELVPTLDPIHQQLHQDSNILRDKYNDTSEDFDNVNDVAELQAIYHRLTTKLNTANRINKAVSTQLAGALQHKRKLWLMNQLLLDANVEIGLPPEQSVITQRVAQDRIDEELLQ